MKGALFDNDIDWYAEALQRKNEYELDDALIKHVPADYITRPNEYSIVINDHAKINPLIANPEALAPEYQAISIIPRDPSDKNLFGKINCVSLWFHAIAISNV